MIEFFLDPTVWIAIAMLVGLELALGVDNLIFVSSILAQVPEEQRATARRFSITISVLVQIVLLYLFLEIIGVERTAFSLAGWTPSWSELACLAGGLFLVYKAVSELYLHSEGIERPAGSNQTIERSFLGGIAQVAALSAVLSVDTVITAVGITRSAWAIVIAILLTSAALYFASGPITAFISKHRSIRVLALAFLLLVGGSIISEGLGAPVGPVLLYSVFAAGAAILLLTKLREHFETGRETTAASADQREEPVLEPITQSIDVAETEITVIDEPVALEETAPPVQQSAPKRRSPRRKSSSRPSPHRKGNVIS